MLTEPFGSYRTPKSELLHGETVPERLTNVFDEAITLEVVEEVLGDVGGESLRV